MWEKTCEEAITLNEGFQFHLGLERTITFITATNAYVEQRAPWKLGKSTAPDDQALLRTSLATIAEALRLAVTLLAPVMPGTHQKVLGHLGAAATGTWREQLAWGISLTGARVDQAAILFPKPNPAAG